MRIIAIMSLLLICLCGLAVSQSTETVLYSFGGYATDGVFPEGSPLFDAGGNIYGVTNGGGARCESGACGGTVYELSPTVGGGWSETILYNFCTTGNSTCADGSSPVAGLIMDTQGKLYGMTAAGGTNGLGIVFRLSPPSLVGGSWSQTVLWTFSMSPENGYEPVYGNMNMDAAGNIYGTTLGGGSKSLGTVFELSPQLNGTYSFSILHSFSGSDGYGPEYGVTFDSAGNLYGTTTQGGRGKSICQYGCGLIYKLSPSGAHGMKPFFSSSTVWSEHIRPRRSL